MSALLGTTQCSHDWDAYDPRLGGAAPQGGDSPGGAGAGPAGGGGSTSDGAGGAQGGAGGVGAGGAGGAGGAPAEQVTYAAAVAACINTTMPNPSTCATENGGNRMSVDLQGTPGNTPRHSYVRFNLDGTLSGKTVDQVTLRVVVSTVMGAESDQTGEVWQVAEFDQGSLNGTVPGQLGSSPLAPNQGMVALGEEVTFTLPSSTVTPNGSVYLGIVPVTTNGVDYWNLIGTDPPTLIVDYH